MSTKESPTQPYTLDRLVRLLMTSTTLVVVVLLLRFLSDVLLPFAAAVILAYLLNPLVSIVERRVRRRGLAVAATIGGLVVVAAAVVALLVPLIVSQATRFRRDVTKLRADLSVASSSEAKVGAEPASADTEAPASTNGDAPSATGWRELMDAWSRYHAAGLGSHPVPRAERLAMIRESVKETYIGAGLEAGIRYAQSEEFEQWVIKLLQSLVAGGWNVLSFGAGLMLGATALVLVMIYLVMLLVDYPQLARQWPMFLPPPWREPVVGFLEQFDLAMRRYFRGQAVVSLATGAMFAIGFSIISLPLAVPFGLVIGLMSMVPYLATTAVIPALFLALIRAIEHDSGFLMSVVWTLLVFAVVQPIQDLVIAPRVMGQATGLRPIAILLGVFIWGKLLGFLGVVLAIPLTCLGIAYYRRFVLRGVETVSAG